MSDLRITAGPFEFGADWVADAPKTRAAFEAMLPFRNKIIHVRWSGESAWIPLGDLETNLPFENHTSHPAPGEILLYPGGFSETEILFPYGGTLLREHRRPAGREPFPDRHREGASNLRDLGRSCSVGGAQDVVSDGDVTCALDPRGGRAAMAAVGREIRRSSAPTPGIYACRPANWRTSCSTACTSDVPAGAAAAGSSQSDRG